MSRLPQKFQSDSLRRAGKRALPCGDFSKGEARQVMGTIDLAHVFQVKQLQAALGAFACLFGRLEQQKYVSAHLHIGEYERDAAEDRRVTVVAAQVRRSAVWQRKRVIVGTQSDAGEVPLRFDVRRVKARAAVVELQRSVFLKKPL